MIDGRHRLWLAGQAGAWPLPVLNVELSDIAQGRLTVEESIGELRVVKEAIEAMPAVRALNTRHLAIVRLLMDSQ